MNDPRCLVADDHPALTTAVSSYLADNGFEVVGPAGDGRRAVALAAEAQPDLALVDYRMPRLFGDELVRALVEASPSTRVVVYTADADETIAPITASTSPESAATSRGSDVRIRRSARASARSRPPACGSSRPAGRMPSGDACARSPS